jgi:hypothetical protein
MKRPLIGGKDFHNFHWTQKTNSRRGHGKVFCILYFSWEEEENECVRRELIVMCEEVLLSVVHGKKCVQTKKHRRKLCVTSNYSGVHEMISMNKPLDFLLK